MRSRKWSVALAAIGLLVAVALPVGATNRSTLPKAESSPEYRAAINTLAADAFGRGGVDDLKRVLAESGLRLVDSSDNRANAVNDAATVAWGEGGPEAVV